MEISERKPYVALIPAYKPSGEMLALLARLKELEFDVVVVDDGSGDPYAHLFRESESYGAVLHHAQNAGKGRALKTGLSYVADKYPQGAVVVTVDADGQHTPPDVLAVCRRAEANPRAMGLGLPNTSPSTSPSCINTLISSTIRLTKSLRSDKRSRILYTRSSYASGSRYFKHKSSSSHLICEIPKRPASGA